MPKKKMGLSERERGKKKVVFVMPPFLPMPPVRGGAMETLTDILIKENEKAGVFDISVICLYDEKALIESKKYSDTRFIYVKLNSTVEKIYDIAKRGFNKVFGLRLPQGYFYSKKAAKEAEKLNASCYIVENYPDGVIPLKKRGCGKVLLHLHNDYSTSDVKNTKKITDKCDGIISVSRFVKNNVVKADGLDDNKVTVFENCVDTDKFNREKYASDAAEIRKRFNVSDDCCLFMFGGRVMPEKGVLELIKAFAKLNGNVKLLIVGGNWYSSNAETEYTKSLKEAAASTENKIVFTGYVDFSDMPKYYCASDVCVVPSICEEASPLSVSEANACSVPVIVTDSGGIPEKVNDKCSLTVKRGEALSDDLTKAMRLLADNPSLREEMGEAGRTLSLEHNTRKYFSDFIKIVNAGIDKSEK